jgi:GAF domain-containing protein
MVSSHRTLLSVPLRKGDALLGKIVAGRLEVRSFTDKQIALLQNFAAQAVIAMENARLLTETREALEQQTATAEVLQVINSSPGDLAPVFDAMLEKALRLCDAAFGHLLTFDGERFDTAAMRGEPSLVEHLRLRGPFRPPGDGTSLLGRIVVGGEHIVQIADVLETDEYRTAPGFREMVDIGGYRSLLNVALRKENILFGVIVIFRKETRLFSNKQIALLQNFAAQAVIAMENARLITETREALEQQTATTEVLQVINSSPGDLAPIFDAILEKAHALCGATRGALVTYDDEWFRAIATRGMPVRFEEIMRRGFPFIPGRPTEQLLRGEHVHILDLPAAAANSPPELARLQLQAVELAGTRTILIVPLCKDGRLLGYIAGYRTEVRPFSDKQIALLENFAAQAVIAMENARLITETREALEQQTATAEVLQVINSSLGDLAPVFDAILEKAHSLCGVEYGVLLTYDGELFWPVATHGAPPTLPDRRDGFRPSSGFRGLVRGERLLHIHDMAEVAAQRPNEPVYRELFENGGIRTQLAVPLRKDGRLLGIITANRREVRPFSDKQIALLENFAEQAVIAIENARLITETREALEQQTATAEVLGVINSSPGDLAPVFDAILKKGHTLCGAAFGGLLTYDGDFLRQVASHNVPAPLSELARQPFRPGPKNRFSELIRGEPLVHVADLAEIAEAAPDEPIVQAAVGLGGVRTLLAVPLRKDGALLGIITAYRQEVRPFSDKQVTLLENFAAQAVIAMENARLITETREALEQQTATAEVLGVINASPGDLQPVFDAILAKAHTLCGAERGDLMTYDGERFRAVAVHGMPQQFENLLREPFGPTINHKRLLQGERLIHIPDVAAHEPTTPIGRAVAEAGARTVLLVPLRKDDVLLGYITATRREVRPFTDKQIALLENFAAQAVIAMENARLLSELHQRTDEVAELNRGLEARVAEQVDELGRVGRLKRFLAPQLAELIVSQGDEKILESHRREIVVVFCDLRGYTAFTETAEPEEVLDFLREYHGALGPLVSQFEGTLDQFSGDGIMVFFNDPVPCPDPAERAVKMAVAMREAASTLITVWRERGRELGFGAGIAQGYATLGQIGFADRSGYTAIGTVCNIAARLCAEAKDGQILLSQRVNAALAGNIASEQVGALALKGLSQPVVAYNVPLAASQPALRVIEGGGPQSV